MRRAYPEQTMDLYTKLQEMSRLQNSHNQRINDDWRQMGLNYRRAIWVECAELMDHLGWKWWKRQDTDHEQVLLEIVDIWHFGLSMLLIEERVNESLATEMERFFDNPPDVSDGHQAIEDFVLATLSEEKFAWRQFLMICAAMEVGFDQLYAHYIAKHVLNEFRQDNGYMGGQYIKVWQGQEDNEHLLGVMRQYPEVDATFQRRIYEALQLRYDEALREREGER